MDVFDLLVGGMLCYVGVYMVVTSRLFTGRVSARVAREARVARPLTLVVLALILLCLWLSPGQEDKRGAIRGQVGTNTEKNGVRK